MSTWGTLQWEPLWAARGFFFAAHRLLPQGTPLFAFQRTPFIARTKDYGASALLLGYKPEVHVAAECMPAVDDFRRTAERLFLTPTRLLGSFYEASLTNSNPILHTGRLFSMWGHYDGRTWERPILFYKEWTDEASQLLIDMDAEFMRLLDVLPMQGHRIPTLLAYYESTDAPSLTAKISSIAAFQTITAPMRPTPNGWVPDFASRYFTEDFPFGLRFIKELAAEHGVPTPTIDKVLAWGMSVAIV